MRLLYLHEKIIANRKEGKSEPRQSQTCYSVKIIILGISHGVRLGGQPQTAIALARRNDALWITPQSSGSGEINGSEGDHVSRELHRMIERLCIHLLHDLAGI